MFGSQAIKFHMDAITLPFGISRLALVGTQGLLFCPCLWLAPTGTGGTGEPVADPGFGRGVSCTCAQ